MLTVFIFCFADEQSAEAKSVYAITDHYPSSTLKAYKIQGDQLKEQAGIAPNYGLGAIDVTADSQSGRLFITYEHTSAVEIIVWVNAKTLVEEDSITFTNGGGLTGIVADGWKKPLFFIIFSALNLDGFCYNRV